MRSNLIFRIVEVAMVGLLPTGCTTGKVIPERSLNSDNAAWVAGQKIPLHLAIVPGKRLSPTNAWEMRDVSSLATNLVRMALFEDVTVGNHNSNATLLVAVSRAHGVLRCGTSLPLTWATLGLLRDDIAYNYVYEFDFVSPKTSKSLSFVRIYSGVYRTGFWPARDDAFLTLLKFDLAQKRGEIESLAKP